MPKSGFVAIIGRPNVGKSTLLNSILGTEISIVTPKAQTTRERVLGILTEKAGQIVFVDTPGIHTAKKGGLNEYMVQQASAALEAPNAVWYLVDPGSGMDHEKAVLELLQKSEAHAARSPIFLLINKSDTIRGDFAMRAEAFERTLVESLRDGGFQITDVSRISAKKGKGVDTLLAKTWACLPEGPFFYPDEEMLSDRPTRFFVSEKIREQLFWKLGDEIPYSCAVEILSYDEKPEIHRIEAVIHVERDSQKGMVIGKAGAKIKEIGQAAREQIEAFVGTKVFLGLQVKVLKDWTKNAEALRQMGYNLPGKRNAG